MLSDQFNKTVIRRRRRSAGIIAPPTDLAHLVWAFDPDQTGVAQYQAGPTGTVTTPVRTGGTPSYYTFGSTDFIDFGNTLETTWDSVGGFTVYMCLKPSAADIARVNAPVAGKITVATLAEWVIYLNSGVIDFYGVYGGTYFANYDVGHSATLVAGTRYVIACAFDPTQARPFRTLVYVNGTLSVVSSQLVGTNGTIAATASPLRLGQPSGSSNVPVSIASYTYAYNGVHSAGTVSSITSWLQTTKGWV